MFLNKKAGAGGIIVLWVCVIVAIFAINVTFISLAKPLKTMDEQLYPSMDDTYKSIWDKTKEKWNNLVTYCYVFLLLGATIATIMMGNKDNYYN